MRTAQEHVDYLMQEINRIYNDDIKKGDFELKKTSVDFTARGLMKDFEKIKKVLAMLHTIACAIEEDPLQ
jgi:hypothetical protein